MPRLQELTGFDSLSMLVDRRSGRAVSVTAFETRDALALVRKQARHLREQFAQAMGVRITDIADGVRRRRGRRRRRAGEQGGDPS